MDGTARLALTRWGYPRSDSEMTGAVTRERAATSRIETSMCSPKPVAARYQKRGLFYRCDLITERILDAEPLSALLAHAALGELEWRAIGEAVGSLHGAGVDHADLNAHNVLLAADGVVSVIDFDRGRLRAPGAWTLRNLRRLRRSLAKIGSGLPPGRFSDAAWRWLLAGYAAR